jgi:hypothetical protein
MISRKGQQCKFLFNGDMSENTIPLNYTSGGYANTLGKNGFGVGTLNGVYYLLYVYNRAFSDSEMTDLYNKLSLRFGL